MVRKPSPKFGWTEDKATEMRIAEAFRRLESAIISRHGIILTAPEPIRVDNWFSSVS